MYYNFFVLRLHWFHKLLPWLDTMFYSAWHQSQWVQIQKIHQTHTYHCHCFGSLHQPGAVSTVRSHCQFQAGTPWHPSSSTGSVRLLWQKASGRGAFGVEPGSRLVWCGCSTTCKERWHWCNLMLLMQLYEPSYVMWVSGRLGSSNGISRPPSFASGTKVAKVGTRQERGRPWRQVPTITIIMMSHGLRATVVANCCEQMPAARCAGMFPTPKSRQGRTFSVQQSVFFLRVWFWSWCSLATLVCMFHVMRPF